VCESLDAKLNSLCEKLKAEMKMKNEKLAASLTNKFKAHHNRLRQEIFLEVQTESKNRTKGMDVLRKDNERKLCKVSENVYSMSANIDETLIVGIHVSNTRKELAISEREIYQSSRVLEWAG
jgi:hypothetical protein